MGVLRRAGFTAATLAAAIAAGSATAATPTTSESQPEQAVILVSTPELPSGESTNARRRWHELRSRSRRILDRVAISNDLSVTSAVPEVGLLAVDLGPGGLPALRRELAADSRVRSVHPDPPVELRYSPNDTAFNLADPHAPGGDLGHWNLIREGAPRAWDLSKGDGAEVAMVDTGVDGTHPDLAGRIAAAQPFGTGSPTTDTEGHGTHTAGLACGQADNGYGIASMGFRCSLFIAKIGSSCSDVSGAVTAAANRNSDVISMSIGGCDAALVPALDYAQSRGSVLVVAADNTPAGDGSYPEQWAQPSGTGPDSSFDRGLVVTSAKYDGTRSSFAEMTSRVSVAAFGSATNSIGGQQGILSSWPANSVSYDGQFGGRTSLNGDNRFGYLVGTSMATPQVSGVAALMRAVKPDLPNTQVVHLIKATASHCGGYGDGVGWGIVRADDAVAAALNRDLDPPASQVTKVKRLRKKGRGRVLKLRLSSTDPAGPQSRCAKLPVSGVKDVVVFAAAKRRAYHEIGKTTRGALKFRAKRHRRYRFYSVAVDKDGNREAPPALPDAKR